MLVDTAQLPLFDEEPDLITVEEEIAKVAWSYSRRSCLEQCARRYYYEYYGSNSFRARNDELKTELRLLKGVQNRYERAGGLLHIAIARLLRERKMSSAHVNRSISWATRVFDSDCAFSRRYPDGIGGGLSSNFPPVLLREYHYRLRDADELCGETRNRLEEAIRSFGHSARYAEFRTGGTENVAVIEHRFRMPLATCRIEGTIDLAYPEAGSVTVVDWKMGRGDGTGDDSLQLAIYALWASQHFGIHPSQLRIYKAHLSTEELIAFRADDSVLASARSRVLQDAERMAALHGYGQAGERSAFSASAKPAICRLCSFQRVCPEGSEATHA